MATNKKKKNSKVKVEEGKVDVVTESKEEGTVDAVAEPTEEGIKVELKTTLIFKGTTYKPGVRLCLPKKIIDTLPKSLYTRV